MKLFCHVVTYAAFILSVLSLIVLCFTLKRRFIKKTSLINEAPETMSLGIRQEDGIKNLNTEKSEKERVKMSDVFSSFYFYEALIILAFTVIGCFVCFFDGISMRDEWLTVPTIAFLIGMAGTLVILSPQIIYYRLKYNLSFKPDREEIPSDGRRMVERSNSSRNAFVWDVAAAGFMGILSAATAYIFMIDFIL